MHSRLLNFGILLLIHGKMLENSLLLQEKKTTFQWDIKINFRDIGPRLRWKIYREWNVNSGKNHVPSSTKAALNSGCFMLHWLFIVH